MDVFETTVDYDGFEKLAFLGFRHCKAVACMKVYRIDNKMDTPAVIIEMHSVNNLIFITVKFANILCNCLGIVHGKITAFFGGKNNPEV